MSTFNPVQFENTEFTDALDTTIVPVPEGDFPAVVKKYEIRTTQKGQVILDVSWTINDPEVTAATGRDENVVRQSLFLDITDHGTLDMSKGKNVQLGRLREAFGQNKPGKPWRFGDIVGQAALVKVTQRVNDETGEIYNDVKKVAAI